MELLSQSEMVYLIMVFYKNGYICDCDKEKYLDELISNEYANAILAK